MFPNEKKCLDSTLDRTCVLTRNQIRLFGDFRIDSKYMKKTPYIEFIQQEHCLPDRALPELLALIDAKRPHGEYLSALFALAQTCYHQEPDHHRYDRNRARFPYPNDADLAAATELKQVKRVATSANPLVSTISVGNVVTA